MHADSGIPLYEAGYGIATSFGTLLPPGAKVAAYVRSTGRQDGDSSAIQRNLVTSLASALPRVRANQGDYIIVLPGHSENVVDGLALTGLRAGTRILGVGSGSQKPAFRWTAQASQCLVDVDDVSIQGCRLRLEGANGVTRAIRITGAHCRIAGCDIQVASAAALKAAIAIQVDSEATDCVIEDNYIYGTETHNVTNCILVMGATVPSDLLIRRNVMIASATAANGLINITVAAKRVRILGNTIYNTHTNSTSCITVGNVAADGVIRDNAVGTMNDGVATAQGIIQGAASLIKAFQNYSCDEPLRSGVLTPVAVAT